MYSLLPKETSNFLVFPLGTFFLNYLIHFHSFNYYVYVGEFSIYPSLPDHILSSLLLPMYDEFT